MGPTGTGKSTFINSIANYLCHRTLKEAVRSEPFCIIPTRFTHQVRLPDGKYRNVVIEMRGRNADDATNEGLVLGYSATQHPRSYSFVKDDIKVNVIDVPGTCDTSGVIIDRENMKRTLAKIQQFSEIHSIWIMVKATENRMTIAFLSALQEIFTIFPRQVVENISFVITHSKASEFRPGDAGVPLTNFIEQLNNTRNLHMDLNSIMFCIDSESFRYQVGYYTSPEFRRDVEEMLESYANSWEKSREATFQLLARTFRATAQPTLAFAAVNNARIAIPCFFNAATKILTTLEKDKSSSFHEELKESLKNRIAIQHDMNVKKREFPQTICTGERCITWIDRPNGQQDIEFRTCHDECHLRNVIYGEMPQTALQDCQIFDINGICNVCHCSYEVHTHVFFDIENVVRSQEIPELTEAEIDAWISDYIKDLEAMTAAIFDAFTLAYRYLRQHAILIFNNLFEKQVAQQIEVQEKNPNPDYELIRSLTTIIEEHRQIVDTLNAISNNELMAQPVTDDEFSGALNNIFAMYPLGETLQKLFKSEQHTALEYSNDFEPISVNFLTQS